MWTKKILRILAITIGVLLIPLVAMQFTEEVNWGLADFGTIGVLIFVAGLTYELITAKMQKAMHRMMVAAAVLFAVLLIWAHLAVGIF
ncbi:MAG TPA: hypothetical protein VEB18_02860 [Candidatus Paceibacterota bacterium]|nr:hypothetical protein [Candidatus Paceibacterota bacterium]